MGNQKGYMVKLGLDDDGVVSGLKDLESHIKGLDSSLVNMDKAIKSAEQSGRDTAELEAAKFRVLAEEVEAVADKLNNLQQISGYVNDAFNAGKIDTSTFTSYQLDVERTTEKLAELQQQMADFGNVQLIENNSQMGQFTDALNNSIGNAAASLSLLRDQEESNVLSGNALIENLRQQADTLQELSSHYEKLSEAGKLTAEQSHDWKVVGAELQECEKKIIDVESSMNNTGKSALTLGDIIKANITSDIIMKGLEKLVDIVKELGDELVSITTETASYGDTIDKQSQRLGMSMDAYQEWSYILSQNGADISTLTTSMRTLTNAVDSDNKAFQKLGLSTKRLKEMTGEQQFSAVITALQRMENETERNAVANDLLGRSYMTLIPLLNQEANSVEELRQKAHDTNQILSEDGVQAAVEYTNAMDTLKKSFDGFKHEIGADVLPGVTMVLDGFTDLINGVDGAEDKITEGIGVFFDGLENALPKVDSILDSIAAAAGDKAPEIISRMTARIKQKLPQISETIQEIAPLIQEGINESLPDIGAAGGEIVKTIINAILGRLADTETTADTLTAFVLMGGNFCDSIADGVMNYDWGQFTNKLLTGIADSLEQAQKTVQVWIDNIFSDGKLYGGDIANVQTTGFINDWRDFSDYVVDTVTGFTEYAAEKYNEGKEILDEVFSAENSGSGSEKQDPISQEIEETAQNISVASELLSAAIDDETETVSALDSALENLEHLYKTHKITEEDYWKQRKEILEKYRDEDSEDWWDAYDKVTEHYEKLAETTRKAAEKAAEGIKKAAQKEADAWEKAADKTADSVKKKYEDVQKQLESSKKEYINALDWTKEVTEAVPGQEEGRSRLVLNDITKQTKELEKYTHNMEKLKATGISEEHYANLMQQDYEFRAKYVDELLRMSNSQRERYYSDYDKYMKAAQEAAAFDVQDELSEANKAAAEGVTDILASMPESAYESGKATALAYLEGFQEMIGDTNNKLIGITVPSSTITPQQTARAEKAASGMSGRYISTDTVLALAVYVDGKPTKQEVKITLEEILRNTLNSGGALNV